MRGSETCISGVPWLDTATLEDPSKISSFYLLCNTCYEISVILKYRNVTKTTNSHILILKLLWFIFYFTCVQFDYIYDCVAHHSLVPTHS